MSVDFNHTIVHVRDRSVAAASLAQVLGLPEPVRYGPFALVECGNGARLYFADTIGSPTPMHYAFLVGEDDFDLIRTRLDDGGITYWPDPDEQDPGQISTSNGRGLYWNDADGNKLELLTVPDGGWPDTSTGSA